MKWKPIAVVLLALAFAAGAANAQTCSPVTTALEALAATCANMARGELCQNGQTLSLDGLPGFTVDTAALGQVQATYPDIDTSQFISMAFVGSLQVTPVVEASLATLPERVPVEVTLRSGKANVRPQPARIGAAIAQLDNGTQLNATGITRTGEWIRVQLPGQPDQIAWMSRTVLHTNYDLALLPVVTSADPLPQYPEFTPMQAFSFTAGAPCSGIVLQSGENLVRLRVEGVDLELHNSTAFLQNTGDALIIHVLEGLTQIQAQETTTVGVAGTLVRVPLDAAGQPNAAPEPPVPYQDSVLAWLAGNYAQHIVGVPPPASDDTIRDALVTPLSGIWKIEYPMPLEYTSKEGPQCGSLKMKNATELFDIFVATDGSSFSTFNPNVTIGAAVRVLPDLYELKDFSFQVLSPTEMTATYDTNPLIECTSIITITAQWMNSGK